MKRVHLERWIAGALLALGQIGVAMGRGWDLFLSPRELLEFGGATLLGVSGSVVLLGLLLEPALGAGGGPSTGPARGPLLHDRTVRVRGLYAVLASGLGAWAAWLLSAGRRVRDLPARPLLVGLFGLVLGAGVWLLLRFARSVAHATPRVRGAWSLGMLLLALSCLCADTWILPRGYPAFHLLLLFSALFACALASLTRAELGPTPGVRRVRAGAALLLALAPISLWHLARQPNASYASAESASFTAKLLRPFLRASASTPEIQALDVGPADAEPVARGVDLRDRDILLITVDALRADLVRGWGGSGLTPEIDKLAAESLRFRRAYTPAPHTSYALASMLTAKFVKPVSELGHTGDHRTVPDLLRRYGYRTAAFYPPAVFFVDGARFATLQARGFGFEYRKEMFAPAEQRVTQLSAYLAQAERRPLFAWVHLFEPHEPYEPPPELVTVDSARGRYEGEVRRCDRAIAELVRVFRAARPRATVVISADHGEEFGDHGGSYHGSTLFEEQVHVPLLWSSPGVVQPGDSDAPVELVDVGSTILSTAGIPRDARMRGDDLSGVLAATHPGPKLAFASVEERHMVTDGRYKAICSAVEAHCLLFDLHTDPRERTNLAAQQPQRVARLRAELFAFLGSIAKREVVGVEQGVGFPEPLVRARLGAPGAGPDAIPLLRDARAAVRLASARVLGELHIEAALPALRALRSSDPEAAVRDEAAVAALMLGDEDARAAVVELLSRTSGQDDGLSLQRRAGLALAALKDVRAVPVLSQLLTDPTQQESERLRAIAALAGVGDAAGVPALIAALHEVRLRDAAARALGSIGGVEARDALLAQLEQERYEHARAAAAEALAQLGDRRVIALVQRFLGMETSIPGGVALLARLSALTQGTARGGSALAPGQRRGGWTCDEAGCTPGPEARIALPVLPAAAARLSLVLDADPNVTVRIAGISVRCAGGPQQVSVPLTRAQRELPVESDGRVRVGAWVVVPSQPEIPPPPPEPWDAGVEAGPDG